MQEKFEEILKEHRIYGEDVEDILFAVNEILHYVADKLKEEEPYAVNTIDMLEIAAYEVFALACYLQGE